jgi:sortase (surface protein transpeptidase)
MILTLVKDPVLSIFLVFFSEIPAIQIGGAFIVSLLFFILEYKYQPSKLISENRRNTISMGIYTVTNFFFLGLHFMEKSISKPTREYLFGIPLIVLVSLLIISNYWISLSETIQNLKKKCAKKGEKANKDDISKIDKTAENSTSQQGDLMNNTGSGLSKYDNQAGLAKSVEVPGISGVKLQNDLG